MSSRITLLAHASTSATAAAAFPAGEPLEPRGATRAAAARTSLPRAEALRRAPERACEETCAAIGLTAEPDEALRGWDLGSWAGRTLDEVGATHPHEVRAWLADPAAAPHGGESLTALLARTTEWLAAPPPGRVLVVCGPAVIRAAVVAVLDAPPAAFWRIDVAPLSVTVLGGSPARWTIRATGAALPQVEDCFPDAPA